MMRNIPLDADIVMDEEGAGGGDFPESDEADDAYQRARDIRQQLVTTLVTPNRAAQLNMAAMG